MDETTGSIIPVWNGLVEPPHIKRMGNAIWLFLWFLDRQTNDETGDVLDHRIITQAEISIPLGIPKQTVGDHMRRLDKWNYIQTQRGLGGTRVRINKPKKWKREGSKTSAARIPGDFGQSWSAACAIAEEQGDPDFRNLEASFWGYRGEAVRKIAEQFVELDHGAIRYAFRQWSLMVDDLEERGKLNMVPTNPSTKLSRLLVFARRKAPKPNGSKESTDIDLERDALMSAEKDLKDREQKGEEVSVELKAIRKQLREKLLNV